MYSVCLKRLSEASPPACKPIKPTGWKRARRGCGAYASESDIHHSSIVICHSSFLVVSHERRLWPRAASLIEKRNFLGLNIGCGTPILFVIRFVLVLVLVVVLDAVLALSISRTRTTTRTMITLCIRRTSTLGSTTVFCFKMLFHKRPFLHKEVSYKRFRVHNKLNLS